MIFFLRSYISLNNRRVCHWYSYALHCISHRRRIEKRGGRCREVFVCGKCVELQIARRRRRHSSRERSTSRSLTFLTRVKFTYESILNPFRTPIRFTDESVTVRRSMSRRKSSWSASYANNLSGVCNYSLKSESKRSRWFLEILFHRHLAGSIKRWAGSTLVACTLLLSRRHFASFQTPSSLV